MSHTSNEKNFPSSKNVRRIKFIEPATLEVEYAGGTYQYSEVGREIFEGACNAMSVGQYLSENVKNVYSFTRVS